MTAAVHDRLAGTPLSGGRVRGGGPARRALVRWAWRLFRREWRQQLLVLALLALAVAATTAGLGVATNAVPDPETKLTLPGSDPQLEADVAALQERFGPLQAVHHQRVAVPGSALTVDLRSERVSASSPTERLVSGRYPKSAGEVALTDGVASTFGIHAGDNWDGAGRALRVVGLVENPQNLDDEFALVIPGQADPADSVSILLPVNDGALRDLHLPSHSPLLIEGRSAEAKSAAALGVLAIATIGLLFVGLVAVTGFTVMAQRRQRALGMLGALGATDRQLRLVMLSNGGIVGLTAGVVGAVIGLLAWLSFESRLETLSAHRIGRWDLPWWAIGAALLLAVMTSVGAAWWPARAASRGSVMTALSNRPPRPRPAHHFAALGAGVSTGALVLLWFARETRPLLSVFGIIGVNLGMLLLAPLAIRLVGRLAGPSPIALRLALRDLVRYQGRSAAALGAITLAVAIAVTTAVSAAYEAGKTPTTAGNLGANQLLLHLGKGPIAALSNPSPSELDAMRERVSAIGKALETTDVVELDAAVNPDAPEDLPSGPGRREPAGLVSVHTEGRGTSVSYVGPAYVASPDLLAHFGIKGGQIDPANDLVSSRKDLADVKLGYGLRNEIAPKVQPLALPTYTSAPNTLITEQAVQRLGLEVTPAGWLFQTSRPLTSSQVNAARKIAAAGGVTIETRRSTDSLSQLGNWVTAAGVVLALAVLGLTVGLIRSETANDLRTLTAAGASAATRRALTGVTAGALALLGATLGALGAYVALVVWHHSHLHPLHNIPASDLLLILVGLPVVAAAGGWVLAGRQPAAMARQPLD